MDKKIRVGIIGVGNMGGGHAVNIKNGLCPDFELVAVADILPERLEWTKQQIGAEVLCYTDAMEMLDSGEIEACMVCVPHYDHPRYAIACMERGIHVMVEKPAGVYTKQVREMNAVAAQHPEVQFGMMFNQRTNCIYRKMREIVQSGQYGPLHRAVWIITNWYRPQSYYDSGNWRATWAGEGGGVLLNQCPHQLDLWQWICGMPVKVDAHAHYGKWHDIEVEDDVTAYVEYPDGGTGVFITTTGDAPGSNRFEIQLDRAKLVAEDDRLTVWELDQGHAEFSATFKGTFGSPKCTVVPIELDGQNPQHVGVVNAWGGAILRGTPLVAHGSEGINGLTLSNAMHLSSFLGRPVELPLDEELYYEELKKRIAVSRLKTGEATFANLQDTYGGVK